MMRAMAVTAILGVVGAAMAISPVAAQSSDHAALLQALSHCASVTPDSARLGCYDGLMPRLNAALAQPQEIAAAPVAKAATAPTKEEQKSWFGFDLGGMLSSNPSQQTTPSQFGIETTSQAKQERAEVTESLDSISDTLADYAYNPFGKFVITLANGQIWRQIPSDDSRAIFSGDPHANTIKIERGALGSYILTINGGNRVYKVTRVK